jgi:hypothetical protein
MKGLMTAGRVPYSVVAMMGLALYMMGHEMAKPAPRIAIAEKSAVILEAALNNPTASPEQMKQIVAQPILSVMQRYQKAGYVIINASRDDQGDMTVDAIPADAVDITNELRTAVHLPLQKAPLPSAKPAAPNGASTAAGGQQ